MEFYDDDKLRDAAERVARLESWQKLETDPAKREEIAEALKDARQTFAAEVERVARERAEQEAANKADKDKGASLYPDGNVTDFLKALDKPRDEQAKKADQAEQTRQAEPEASPAASAEAAAELDRVRELEPPKEITDDPEWRRLYEQELGRLQEQAAAEIAGAIEASAEPARSDADNVPELEPGAEISGEVQSIERRGDLIIYVVRDDDGMLAALEDDARNPQLPELEEGDRIDASRDRDGEYSVSYDNGHEL